MMRDQRGFTLIEILLALGIAGIITPVLISMLFQISFGTIEINRDFAVQSDIDTASNFFSLDLSQAQTTDIVDLADPVSSMLVGWVDETGFAIEEEGYVVGDEVHCVRYSLSLTDPTFLLRNYDGASSCTVSDPSAEMIVARHVAEIWFSRVGTFITIKITSTYDGDSQALSYFVSPRPEGAFE